MVEASCVFPSKRHWCARVVPIGKRVKFRSKHLALLLPHETKAYFVWKRLREQGKDAEDDNEAGEKDDGEHHSDVEDENEGEDESAGEDEAEDDEAEAERIADAAREGGDAQSDLAARRLHDRKVFVVLCFGACTGCSTT